MSKNRIIYLLFFCFFLLISFHSSFAVVSVKVSDTSGSPVANALVTLTKESDPTLNYNASTDKNGLCTININGTAIEEKEPQSFALGQNYPNPFNPTTVIPFSLAQDGEVKLVIYNALGQNARTLVDGWFSAGVHTVVWDGRDDNGSGVGSGIYIYVLNCGNERQSKKMLLIDGHSGKTTAGTFSWERTFFKPSVEADTYTVKIACFDIEPYEQAGNLLSDDNTYEYVVTRKEETNDIILTGVGMTGTPVSDDQRKAVFSKITLTLNNLIDIPDSVRFGHLALFLAEQPEIEIAGYDVGGVWARFTDGRLIIFDANVEAEDLIPVSTESEMKIATSSNETETSRSAIQASSSWTDIPESKRICLYRNPNESSEWLNNVKLYVEQPTDENGNRIYSYTVDGGIKDASVEAFMNIPGDCAVFALHTHGSNRAYNRSWEPEYALYTTTPVTLPNEIKYWDLLKTGQLVYYHPVFFENLAGVIIFTDQYYHYAISTSFIENYWVKSKRFETAKTFVYFNVCSSFSEKSSKMVKAIYSSGASLYAGWTYRALGHDGPATASYIFDRLLGSNMWGPTMNDPHRPFSWDTLHDEMISLGYGKSYDDKYGKDKEGDAQYSWLKLEPAPNSPFKLLAPSIKYMDVDEKTETDEQPELTIYGTFGDTQGEVFIKKESVSSSSPLTIKEWNKDKIICYLQKDDYGDVSVKVNGNRSNLRSLSKWKGKVEFTVIPNPTVPNQTSCTLQDQVTWDLKLIRADVAPYRERKPEEKPASREVRFLPTRESTTTYTSSGSQVIQAKDGPVTVFSWSGNGTLKINDSREENTSRLAYTLDTGTKIAKMDILFLGKLGTKIIGANNNQTSSNQQINTSLSMLWGLYDEASSPNYRIYSPFDDSWNILPGEKKITVTQYTGVAGLANAPVKVK
ncbi:MAG: T9SS type A sorting domain-containing protein [Candidatus Latescibacteria bacterium]|nr:T9SS type A sorting domain-containing protein [Candidatus Latescibacterota bacterium]